MSGRQKAVVTRYGCWRGEFFEGYEAALRGTDHKALKDLRKIKGVCEGKRGELQVGSGVQQTREPNYGANR
jgi:hypothetical protein